ncbi:unnamed protein product, partial [marine sediment metagenome]
MNILQVRRELEAQLLKRPGITGVGNVGNKLRIYVEGTDGDFPAKINNFPVEVFKTGPIKALSHMDDPLLTVYEKEADSTWIIPKASV